jgi:3-deoxy-D-manno-octulosonic-acid transferase
VAVLVVAGLVFFFFYRRTQKQNTRFDAAITRLQTGVLTQQQLMERSRRALEDGERSLVFTAFQAVTPDSRAQILLLLVPRHPHLRDEVPLPRAYFDSKVLISTHQVQHWTA